jgi:hypothetical protein
MSAVNVIHLHASSGTPAASDCNTAFQAAWQTNQLQGLQNQAVLGSVSIIPLDGISGSSTFTTTGTGKWIGSETGDVLVAIAGMVKIQTGLRGRNRRGRVYLPFIGEAATVSGTLTTTVQAAMSTAWNAFQGAIAASTPIPFLFGVASYDRKHSGAGAMFTPATTTSVESFVGTQRRRQSRLRG